MTRPMLLVVAATLVLPGLAGTASAQIAPESRPYPPLYAGTGSQAAQSSPQQPDPVFFFEERTNWPALVKQIPGGQPRTAWEFAQRGMYKQDELEDIQGAVADYKTSESMNSRLEIVQARLGVIALKEGIRLQDAGQGADALTSFGEAIDRLDHVLEESPFRQGLHFAVAEAYEHERAIYTQMGNASKAADASTKAEMEFDEELKLAPGSQRAHLALAELLIDEGRSADAVPHLDTYLCQARLHSDPYPFKILQARKQRNQLAGATPLDCARAGSSAN